MFGEGLVLAQQGALIPLEAVEDFQICLSVICFSSFCRVLYNLFFFWVKNNSSWADVGCGKLPSSEIFKFSISCVLKESLLDLTRGCISFHIHLLMYCMCLPHMEGVL